MGFILFPAFVLAELGIELGLFGRNGIEIVLVVECTRGTERTVEVVAGYASGSNGGILHVHSEHNVGIFVGVEELELMPADEVPVADAVVEHEFAAAEAADFPDERRNAHVVGCIVEAFEVSHCETVDGSLVETGTFPEGFHVVDEVGVGEFVELSQFESHYFNKQAFLRNNLLGH